MVTYVTDHGCTEVKVVFKSPEKITESGIIVDGQEQDFDAIICATGFECQYKPFDLKRQLNCALVATSLPRYTRSKVSELLHHQWSEKQLGSWLHTTNCDS